MGVLPVDRFSIRQDGGSELLLLEDDEMRTEGRHKKSIICVSQIPGAVGGFPKTAWLFNGLDGNDRNKYRHFVRTGCDN